MPVDKKGFRNIIGNTPQQNVILRELDKTSFNKKGSFVVGRVTDIILNKNHTLFNSVGKYNGIGTIVFKINGTTASSVNTAKPLHPQSLYIPVINELVLLYLVPNTNMGKIKNSVSYYYANIVNLWNSPHHNAYPDPLELDNKEAKNNIIGDYETSEAGIVRRITDGSSDIRLNTKNNRSQVTFKEKNNIYPLEMFSGDFINQGRFGNSIRLGSTNQYLNVKNEVTGSNNWSQNKQNNTTTGDPIIILRNGQPDETSQLPSNSWEPISENINYDKSSIYLTSTQKIEIKTSNNEFTSYKEKNEPSKPDVYTDSQIILNSNRLVFNAKKDHVLISGEESVYLGGNRSVNINAGRNIILECSDFDGIKLGSKDASQSLILGDKFLSDLNQVMDQLSFLCKMLQSDTIWPAGVSAPKANVIGAAIACESLITTFQNRIESYKSKVSKTV